jgi:hypothetical protein
MAGQTMRVLPRTDYDVSGLAASGVGTVLIARKIDTSRWREAVVLARFHAGAYPSGATIALLAAPDGYTDEDPGLIWNFTTATLLTFTSPTDAVPIIKNASIAAPFGPLIQLQWKFTVAAGTGSFKPSLSLDLNLKGE